MQRETKRLMENYLGWSLFFRRVMDGFDKHVRERADLRISQARALLGITLLPSSTLNHFAEMMELKSNSMNYVIDELEDHNLIVRVRKESNKRCVYLEATAEGAKKSLVYLDAISSVLGSHLRGMSSKRRDEVLRLLAGDLLEEKIDYLPWLEALEEYVECNNTRLIAGTIDRESLALAALAFENMCSMAAREILYTRRIELTPNELRALQVLALSDEPLMFKELCKRAEIFPSAGTKETRKLKYKKLIICTPAANDKRAVDTTLTDKGRELVEQTTEKCAHRVFGTLCPELPSINPMRFGIRPPRS